MATDPNGPLVGNVNFGPNDGSKQVQQQLAQRQQQLQQWIQAQQSAQQVYGGLVGSAAKQPEPQKSNEFVDWAERVRMNRFRKPVFYAAHTLFFGGILLGIIGIVWWIWSQSNMLFGWFSPTGLKLILTGVGITLLGSFIDAVVEDNDFWTKPKWME